MANKREHGERNKSLSADLVNGKVYYDWAITTAFYSAIHFVEDNIFPTTINGGICKNISECKLAYNLGGRHAAREKIVFEKLGTKIGARYKWLDDNSRNSRYTTYKITSSQANKAKEYLEYIYEECYSKKAE